MFPSAATFGQQTPFKVLAFYCTKVEPDHVLFAESALKFFSDISKRNNFAFDSTSNWDDMNDSNLGKYQVVVWLNDRPSKTEQKHAFQKYIENGGAWLGFHASGTTIKIPTGLGSWIFWVAAYFISIAGPHCPQNWLSTTGHILWQSTPRRVSYRLTTSGISGNQAPA
jgi:hypothetical protein